MLQGLALGLTAAASPGPLQTYLINYNIDHARKSLGLAVNRPYPPALS